MRQPGFAGLVRIIIEQQIAFTVAQTLWRRLAETTGEVTPDAVLALSPEQARSCGLSRQKQRYVRHAAQAVLTGDLDFTKIDGGDAETRRAALSGLTGVGPWSVDMYELFCHGAPNIWPVADLAVAEGWARIHDLPGRAERSALEAAAADLSPHASAAALYCWQAVLEERKKV